MRKEKGKGSSLKAETDHDSDIYFHNLPPGILGGDHGRRLRMVKNYMKKKITVHTFLGLLAIAVSENEGYIKDSRKSHGEVKDEKEFRHGLIAMLFGTIASLCGHLGLPKEDANMFYSYVTQAGVKEARAESERKKWNIN